MLLVLPDTSLEYGLTAIYRKPLLDKGTGTHYVSTSEFLHYGIVSSLQSDEYIITFLPNPISKTCLKRNMGNAHGI